MKNETVNWNNYEEYLLLEVDGELDEAGRQALQAFMHANPEVEEELSMYESTKLLPDEAITFGRKDALLKREPRVVVMPVRQWIYAAAAMLVGAAIVMPILWKTDDTGNRQPIVVGHQAKPSIKTTPAIVTPVVAPRIAVAAPQEQHIAAKQESRKMAIEVVVVKHVEDALTTLDATAALPIVRHQPGEAAIARLDNESLPAIAPIVAASKGEETKAIHFAPQNSEAFRNIKNAVATNVDKIEHVRNLFKETALSVRLGSKNININF